MQLKDSDIQLRDAVMRATTWTDVLRLLDVTDDGTSRGTVKAHAIRLRLDFSHLESAVVIDDDPRDLLDMVAEPSKLRVAAASIASAWFLLRGMAVALPLEPDLHDLLVTMPDGIKRV